MEIALTLFRGIRPGGEPAVLVIHKDGNAQLKSTESTDYEFPLKKLRMLGSQGNQRRLLLFPNGWSAECREVEQFDQLGRKLGKGGLARLINLLERHYRWTLVAVVLTALFCGWLYLYALPRWATSIAHALPVSVAETLSQSTWELLDQRMLKESTLTDEQRQPIADGFQQMIATLPDSPFTYRLYFRDGHYLGANALALPSGQIVVTDQLVNMARHPDEILAILAHEIGHVEQRHGLRTVIQSSSLFIVLTVVTGDLSGVGGLAASLPTLLLESGYSRRHEREADQFALEFMLRNGMDPAHFAEILQRLDPRENSNLTEALGYLETHPIGTERIRPFLEAAEEQTDQE